MKIKMTFETCLKKNNKHEWNRMCQSWLKSTFSQVPCPPLVLGSAQAGFWRRILDDKASFWQVFSWGGCCNTAQIVMHELFGGSNTKGGEVDGGFVTFCLNWKSARILSLLEPEHLMIEAVTCNHWAILTLESVFFSFECWRHQWVDIYGHFGGFRKLKLKPNVVFTWGSAWILGL